MKKVLGLVASPRKTGNSEMLAKEILANTGADTAKELIRLTDLDLKYCKACYACLPKEAKCPLDDDLGFLLDKIRSADAVVIASPVYFLGPHVTIKLLQDRLLSVGANPEDFQGKRCVTAASYGVPGWEGYALSALNLLAHFLHLDLVDSLLIKGANPGEVWLDPANQDRVREVGRNLLNPDWRNQPAENQCPVCRSDIFRFQADGTLECPICGVHGKVETSGGRPWPSFNPAEPNRLTPEAKREHFEKWLVMKKEEFLANRTRYKELQKPYQTLNWWAEKA